MAQSCDLGKTSICQTLLGVFQSVIETGVLHEVGLRDTLEPDPDNTGVGSFRGRGPSSSNRSVSSLVSCSWRQGDSMLSSAAAVRQTIRLILSRRAFRAGSHSAVRWQWAAALLPGRSACRIRAKHGARPAGADAASRRKPSSRLPRVTTTVVVHGEVKDDYLPDAVTVGTLDGATLEETPLSATVVTARSAQRSGRAPALRRGEERRLHRRGLRAGGLLRRLRDSRLPHRSGHGTCRSTA